MSSVPELDEVFSDESSFYGKVTFHPRNITN